jgi:hypothetical protein
MNRRDGYRLSARRILGGPSVLTALLLLASLALTGCGGETTAVDDEPSSVHGAVDLSGVEVQILQSPG